MKIERFIEVCVWITAAILLVLLYVGIFAPSAFGGEVDQAARWQAAKVDSRQTIALDKLVQRWRRTAGNYQAVEFLRDNGVPAPVSFCLFYREADNNMACSPAQGDPLTHLSINEPRGRLPGKKPPFRWIDCAEDAYYVVDRLDRCNWKDLQSALDKMESFNGFGYRARGVAAPYLWAGTSLYTRGKYVSDGRFDRFAVDRQLGVCAILKRMQERGIPLPF